MRTSLVVGGAGFIGSNLVRELVSRGHHCIVVDNGSSLGSIRPLPKETEFVFKDVANLSEAGLGKIDYVFYLAAKCAGISFNMHHQREMLLSNLHALSGIKSCLELKPDKFIYFSTVCVYPAWAPVPTSEFWGHWGLPEKTNLGYGLAKRWGELTVRYLRLKMGIPTMVVRPSNTFGPWDFFDERYGHFVPSLLIKMLRGDQTIRVWGGKQTRSFVFVNDVANITLNLAESAARDTTVNLGHSVETAISEACNIISEEANYQGKLIYTSGPIGYKRRAADSDLLVSLIGSPNWTTFREGIRATIAWMKFNEDWWKGT